MGWERRWKIGDRLVLEGGNLVEKSDDLIDWRAVTSGITETATERR